MRPRQLVGDRRFWQVLAILLRFVWQSLVEQAFLPRQPGGKSIGCPEPPLGFAQSRLAAPTLRRRKAVRIRELLIELGPTFIKVGQFLSVRRDALPLEIAEELSLLQDRVPPVEAGLVRATIEAELGRPPEELFDIFDQTPIASASIGQVHRALLKDGRPIVLKIQRPGLAAAIYQDLGYMRLCAAAAGKLGWSQAKSWLALTNEFGRTLFEEIDYLKEGRNADRLRTVLRNYPQVKIPRVYWRYTGRRVIALEYLPGAKIDDVARLKDLGLNFRTLGNLLIGCYLEQVVSSGFFHADPHPGNLAVDADGNLIIYDFGMMGEISAAERAALAACISAICRRDAQKLADNLVELGVITSSDFRAPVARAIQPLIDYYCGRDILALDFSHLEADVDALVAGQALCLPPSLAYLLRTGTSLEGIARTLRPNFSFASAARPFLWKLAVEQGLITLERTLEEFAAQLVADVPTSA